jgi:hypothetical protein
MVSGLEKIDFETDYRENKYTTLKKLEMNNEQKSIIKNNMHTVTYADVIYWIYFRQS